jgi:hypothetical protein
LLLNLYKPNKINHIKSQAKFLFKITKELVTILLKTSLYRQRKNLSGKLQELTGRAAEEVANIDGS